MSSPLESLAAPERLTAPVIARRELLGLPIALTTYGQTLDWIDATVGAGDRGYVCVAAVHTVMASQEDPALRAAVLGSDLTVPDGQPLVWALGALGHKLPDRVYGPTLMERACERAARSGLRFYLYGGRDQAALDRLVARLRSGYPGLKIVGSYCPPFRALSQAEEAEVIADVDGSHADVVWVGIGVPKQEKWMARMRERLQAPVLIGVGAAFDFHAGLVPQAPQRLQKLGLEWLFRLVQEPRRLWRRYLRYNPRFILGFTRQYARHRRARRA
jgi:N-acetylglucosaminyldiphosphoundecaprenol N-acetyl-beta-D-mannosaminyltransferase